MKKDLKNKIISAYEQETPDLKEKISLSCQSETQLPEIYTAPTKTKLNGFVRTLIAFSACLAVFVCGLFVGKINPNSTPVLAEETCVYLDVNPSLTLSLDKNDTVLSCTASNQDAEKVLNGMNLVGVELNTALNAIIGSMYTQGYLSVDDNSILISVDSNNQATANDLLTDITEQINNVFKNSDINCSIIAQKVSPNEQLKQRAEENGVSVGKMHLVDKMVDKLTYITENDIPDLTEMSIKDLNLIYSQYHDEVTPEEDDDEIISGTVNVNFSKQDAFNAVLEQEEISAKDVEEYFVEILPSKEGEKRATYIVKLKLKNDLEEDDDDDHNDEIFYSFMVDCQTGEVTEIDNAPQPVPPQNQNGNEENNQTSNGLSVSSTSSQQPIQNSSNIIPPIDLPPYSLQNISSSITFDSANV